MSLPRKIISYTLYGNEPRYTQPLLKNADLIKIHYPAWDMYVYHDYSVDEGYLEKLAKMGVVLINVTDHKAQQAPPKLWRFFPVFENDLDCVVFRDADSLLTHREASLVEEWLSSDFSVHIIRDHPLHISPILAGMFGVKKSAFSKLRRLLLDKKYTNNRRQYDYDQVMLADYFYPVIRSLAMIHSSFFRIYGENICRIDPVLDGGAFIGAVDCQSNKEKKRNQELLFSSIFLNGVPYQVSRVFRYRIRPVLYSSMIHHFLFKIFRIN